MLKTLKIFAGLMLCASLASSCVRVRINVDPTDPIVSFGKSVRATGEIVEKTVEFSSDYYAIEVHNAADIVFFQDDTCYAEVSARESAMELLEMVVEDGRLFIGNKNNVSVSDGKMRIVLHSHSISRFDVFGACDLDSDCMTTDGDFNLSISGAGDVEIKRMEAASLNVSVKGAGDISIYDAACSGNIGVVILGAGDITIGGYCNDAEVSITGGGDIDIRSLDIRGEFTKHVAGGGDIRR